MILVSSSGVSPAIQMEYSAVSTLKVNNYSNEIIKIAKHLRNITNEYYRGNRDKEMTQLEIDKYRGESWFQDVYLPWRGNLPEDVKITKWIHEMDFNPLEYFETITVPILLLYGETDRWVPPNESILIWKKALKKAKNNQFEIHRIKKSGHMMILNEDNNLTQEIISEEYTETIRTWLKKQQKTFNF
jgi:pimeloyl-ACP methyl ester carboxylesterase